MLPQTASSRKPLCMPSLKLVLNDGAPRASPEVNALFHDIKPDSHHSI